MTDQMLTRYEVLGRLGLDQECLERHGQTEETMFQVLVNEGLSVFYPFFEDDPRVWLNQLDAWLILRVSYLNEQQERRAA